MKKLLKLALAAPLMAFVLGAAAPANAFTIFFEDEIEFETTNSPFSNSFSFFAPLPGPGRLELEELNPVITTATAKIFECTAANCDAVTDSFEIASTTINNPGVSFDFDESFTFKTGTEYFFEFTAETPNTIADNAVFRYALGVVPEPSTWIMMILGFGFVAMRLQRKSRTAIATA